MSVSKWAYDPDKCEGDYCVGDCDKCSKAERTGCIYPECEECDHYTETKDGQFCTVPIIVSKQMWLMMSDRMDAVERKTKNMGAAMWAAIMDITEFLS